MDHHNYLTQALQLARLRKGFTAPNPAVGAIIVKDNQIIAQGYHEGPGLAHAEVAACAKEDVNYNDAVMYVTLEPCCHWGRTPPCTDTIISKGIKAVYYGYEDPNPKVAGGGKKWLEAQGIHCEKLSHNEIATFYEGYHYWFSTQKPWVISKLAISMDGKIADEASRPVKITGPEAARYTHEGRRHADAILTTIRTIIQDDPLLNVRIDEITIPKRLYILDTNLMLPLNARVLQSSESITLFHSSHDQHKIDSFAKIGVHCHRISTSNHRLCLEEVLAFIGQEGVHELWVEAGGTLFNALVKEGLAHKSYIYVAPKLLGPNALSAFIEQDDLFVRARRVSWSTLGQDSICEILW